MPNKATTLDQFSEVLNKLTDFQDYFTEDSKINELVEYVHSETNVPRAAVRLAIKRIAPFLASSVGVPMLDKLHSKLSEYSWYYTLSQRLLDSLKTIGDKTLDLALNIPSNERLEALITDKAKWANLKPEYQGLVQLLLGQNEISEGLDGARNAIEETLQRELNTIVNKLSFHLDLRSPDFLISEARDAEAGSAQWLTYASRQAMLIGRNALLNQLESFFDQENSFGWWVISGGGGVGKSRLALDSIEPRQALWDVGFLSNSKLKKDDALSGWLPQSPTIIVIDYAAEYPEAVSQWLDYFIQHREQFDFPVRLLILEREYKNQQWWEQLVEGSSAGLNRKKYLYRQAPQELEPLNYTEQQVALHSFLDSLGYDGQLPEEESTFWETLDALSDSGKPLFIGMVAVAIVEYGINRIRKWNQEELLRNILAHEKSAWERQLKDFTPEQKATIYQLLAFTTATSGLNFDTEKRLNKLLKKCGFGNNKQQIEDNIAALYRLTGGVDGYLQPDILGEYFVLQQWKYNTNGPNSLLKKRLLAAQKLYPENTYAFLVRSAVDYPRDTTPFRWWSLLNEHSKDEETKWLLNQIALIIAAQLSLHGYYIEAITNWLPPLCESEFLKTKASALNLLGLQNSNLGNYPLALSLYRRSFVVSQEVGDKSGEGTTLNNISQIYFNHGDYESALSYLNQSLAIRQEVGDKSGEGSTLNNISQIYSARSEHNTALVYLEKSLTISQEMGNRSEEGTALNNIASIFSARGDYDTALKYLEKALVIKREIGDRSGEGETLNNTSQIYSARGDYETALSLLGQSLAIRQEIGDKSGEGSTLNNISQIYDAHGDYETALSYLHQSLSIHQELGDKSDESAVLNNISQIYSARNEYKSALDYLERSLLITQKLGSKSTEGVVINNMGNIAHAKGDYKAALRYYKQSLDIAHEIDDIAGWCLTKFNIGYIQWQNNETEDAIKSWLKAYQIAKKIGLAKALEDLKHVAEQLELPGGLEGWETVSASQFPQPTSTNRS